MQRRLLLAIGHSMWSFHVQRQYIEKQEQGRSGHDKALGLSNMILVLYHYMMWPNVLQCSWQPFTGNKLHREVTRWVSKVRHGVASCGVAIQSISFLSFIIMVDMAGFLLVPFIWKKGQRMPKVSPNCFNKIRHRMRCWWTEEEKGQVITAEIVIPVELVTPATLVATVPIFLSLSQREKKNKNGKPIEVA